MLRYGDERESYLRRDSSVKRSSKAHSIGCFAKNFYGFAKQIFFTPKNAQNPGILHPDLRFRKAESWRLV
jgi:hypothetical protein